MRGLAFKTHLWTASLTCGLLAGSASAELTVIYPSSEARFEGPITQGQASEVTFGYSPDHCLRVGDADGADHLFRAGFKFQVNDTARQAIGHSTKVVFYLQANGGQWGRGIDGVHLRGYKQVTNADGHSPYNVDAGKVQIGEPLYQAKQLQKGIRIDLTQWAKQQVVGTEHHLGLNVHGKINNHGGGDGHGNQIYLYGGAVDQYAGPEAGRARIEIYSE
jgi:hypothetical protein